MPSGAVLEKEVVIANGCVVDPKVLLKEIENLEAHNKNLNLKLSSTAHVIFPFHKVIDGLEEKFKGDYKAGTTKRGIGPTYSDKAARFGLRVFDLIHPELLERKLKRLYDINKKVIHCYDPDWIGDFNEILEKYKIYGQKLKKYVKNTAYYLNTQIDKNKKVIFEGAQGTLLGIDHGFYPFGTSSNANSSGISNGTGVPPNKIGQIIGIIKAYTSRVGEGAVPTELYNETGDLIREQGNEYGTTTGRPRRVGWLDLFNTKYSVMINGVENIAIMLLDALEGIDPLKICIGYELDDKILDSWPIQPEIVEKCIPIYKNLKGWEKRPRTEWSSIAKEGYASLPEEMKIYIDTIKKHLDVEVCMISIGPQREDTIVLKEFF